ncbi:MAG: hypothetical protein AB1489_24210 [Acidobacteriota bacterium]
MVKIKVILIKVLVGFIVITLLHVWLNIGFSKLGFTVEKQEKTTFKVGFLPVT